MRIALMLRSGLLCSSANGYQQNQEDSQQFRGHSHSRPTFKGSPWRSYSVQDTNLSELLLSAFWQFCLELYKTRLIDKSHHVTACCINFAQPWRELCITGKGEEWRRVRSLRRSKRYADYSLVYSKCMEITPAYILWTQAASMAFESITMLCRSWGRCRCSACRQICPHQTTHLLSHISSL